MNRTISLFPLRLPLRPTLPISNKYGLSRGRVHLTRYELDLHIPTQTINSVALRETTSESAVQKMIHLATNKSHDELAELCYDIFMESLAMSQVSRKSAQAVKDFLVSLSKQSQHTTSDPIEIYGSHLWRDMPLLAPMVNSFWNHLDVPKTGLIRKIKINEFLNNVRFTSLLFRSSQPAFAGYNMFLFWSFRCGLEWPVNQYKRAKFDWPDDANRREAFDIWIPAMTVQMDVAGPELMDTISDEPSLGTRDRLTFGRWRFWQQRLLKIAADKTMDVELRRMARWTSERMAL